MAKARPKNPARDRAIAAFKKAHPDYQYALETYKVRSKQCIRVRACNLAGANIVAEWSYKNNGSLERIN